MLTPATGGPGPRLDDWDETVVRTRRLGRACLPQPFSFAQFGLHCQRVPVKGLSLIHIYKKKTDHVWRSHNKNKHLLNS
ncbi:hypothetical protein, partial [Stenotrophomonas maltophilia]|uniref:hypothetical protein n=1 Tax=Stenotrophomonas maltophilia TaxID=40324 RepID=UPI001A7E1BA2